MAGLSPANLADLERIVGPAGLRHGELASMLDEGINAGNLGAGVMVSPRSTAEVSAIAAYCNELGIAIVPHGGRTGVSGGAVSEPGQLIVQMTRMDQVLSIDAEAGTAIVEAGATLHQLQEGAAMSGLSLGVDLGARGSATLGGMVSTNAGGSEAFRHGVTRNRVLGLEVVLADGRVLDDLKRVTKVVEGYDIKQLFIGAEGTLGIVTRIAFALVPQVTADATALVSCDTASQALALLHQLRSARDGEVLTAEIMWPLYARTTSAELGLAGTLDFAEAQALFVVLDIASPDGEAFLLQHLEQALETETISGAVMAKNEQERARFWSIREESFLCDQRYPHGFWYDVSVPLGELDRYAAGLFERVRAVDSDLQVFLFGHLGDGNLHLTVSAGREVPELEAAIEDAVFDGIAAMGGSFSAEHGIGDQKRATLARYASAEKLALMQDIKQMLDPNGIMNPGKVL